MRGISDHLVRQAKVRASGVAGVIVAVLAAATAATGAGRGRPASPLVAVDLDTLGGRFSQASAVNADGMVVGRSSIDGYGAVSHAFAWTEHEGMRDLGTLGGNASWANAVTDAGVVSGY